MKRIFTALLLCLCILCAFGCSAGREGGAASDEDISDITDDTEVIEMGTLKNSWMSNGFDKVKSDALMPEGAKCSCLIYMAKNETEGCQFTVRPDEKLTGVKLEYETDIAEGITLEVLREADISMTGGYPDPVYPPLSSITLPADTASTFLIKVKSEKTAQAGDYTSVVKLAAKDGEALGIYTVNVHVWNFTLPDAGSCATAVGLYGSSIQKITGCDPSEVPELYELYYNRLLEYRVCAYDLPYDILDERADRYMSDPRVTAFKIPYPDDDAKITAYYEKLSSNPEWFAKAYFYPLDEPTSVDHLNKLAVIAERLARLYPGYRLCTPFFTDIKYDNDTDQVEFMTGKTNLWCPKTFLYNGYAVYNGDSSLKSKYGMYSDRMAKRQELGDEVWWYVCWEPGDPYCNLFVDQKGLQHRLLFWQQRYYDVTGFLYWGANYWQGTDNPWTDIATVKELSPKVYGDGSLLYNGNCVAVKGACGSMRLEAIRDGIEDYEMLTLAYEALGEDYVRAIIEEVTPSLVRYTDSSETFEAARIRIGNELEAKIG